MKDGNYGKAFVSSYQYSKIPNRADVQEANAGGVFRALSLAAAAGVVMIQIACSKDVVFNAPPTIKISDFPTYEHERSSIGSALMGLCNLLNALTSPDITPLNRQKT